MRIYEVAKKYNISSKEIVVLLQAEGFPVTNHMNLLSEQELIFLKKILEKKNVSSFSEAKKQQTEKSDPSKNKESKKENNLSLSSEPKDIILNMQTPSVRELESLDKKNTKASNAKSPLAKQIEEKEVASSAQRGLIIEPMNVETFAETTKISVNDVIVQLLRWGIVITKNQMLKEEIVLRLANHYAIVVEKRVQKTESNSNIETKTLSAIRSFADCHEKRNPVVVVIGHIDHGKTTLLDFIRNTRVAAKEKGGITQHIGAHEVKTSHGNLVFIDTPGHEAFTKIRQRGIRVADIAILVVAADDGVMPQTVEAIKQAKAMNLSIIVAINKIDRVAPERIEIVKKQLIQYDLIPEDWGGDIICVPISAKMGKGIEQLLDMVSLQSEMMELKTSTSVPAVGYVLETKLERGRGVVATILCHTGILEVGNFFLAGAITGRITSMINSFGKPVVKALPTVPVQVAGFDGMPEIGEVFKVLSKAQYLEYKDKSAHVSRHGTMHTLLQTGAVNLILKADTESSKEAVLDFISALNKKSKKQFNVVLAGIGMLNESDIELAYNVNAQVIVMHAKIDSKALVLANVRKITIHQFDVIYKMTEFLKQWLTSQSNETVVVRKKVGQAEVLRVFDIKGVGVIAGSIVKDGRFVKDGIVVALRNGKKIGEGKISGLQRERKAVKEVHTGFECGFMVENVLDWQVGDTAECYVNQTEIHQL
ncbi:translation initiation factor IF-2 [Candidatus Dependentiae bacterium]|nr:MAG: translation initiation factor IF-2 [Candidatus Dependentiae bacterium]